jgi:ankyrin repeat protein
MGGSPLHRAAYEGHSEIVELLISEGANAEAKTGDGKTVLDFANEEIARLIRKSIDEKKQKQNNP